MNHSTLESARTASGPRPGERDVRWALAALASSMLLSSLGTGIANVGLPTMAHAFDVPVQSVQWVVIAYLLTVTTTVVAMGRLGDRMGRRRVLLGGIALFTGASALCGLATTLPELAAARVLQGLGGAAMMALTTAMVGEAVPKARSGSAMGLLGSTSAVGTALGPAFGGGLIAVAGWPALFLATVPLGVVAGLLAWRKLPAVAGQGEQSAAGARFDVWGMLVLGATLAAYALALTWGGGRFSVVNAVLLVAASLGVPLFLRIEAAAAAPLVQLSMFRDRAFCVGLATGALVSAVVMTTFVVGPFHLSLALGLDVATVGVVMALGPGVAAMAGAPAGHAVDRFGSRGATLMGLALVSIGAAGLAVSSPGWGVVGYAVPLVVTTAGYALFQAANNTAVMAAASPTRRGVVSGLMNLARNLGLITGASVMGGVFARVAADAAPVDSHAAGRGSMAAFAMAAALAVLAWGLAARRR